MVNINTRYCFVSKDHSYFVYSDASAAGGGVIIDFNNDLGATKCVRRTREFKVQRGRSCLLLSFHCNHLSQCWKDHTLSGLLIAAKIVDVGSMKLVLHKMARRIFDIYFLMYLIGDSFRSAMDPSHFESASLFYKSFN